MRKKQKVKIEMAVSRFMDAMLLVQRVLIVKDFVKKRAVYEKKFNLPPQRYN